ncbi:MAG TPA: transglutaminase domain-containing protein [Candidatus Altiarchaeales archaeon]|nr:transglutaminase domain-containing protein [Candidatus Altiarchaeales archaeon]
MIFNMRFSILFLVLIFFLSICTAEITDPSSISEIGLKIVHNGTVETPFRLEKVSIDLIMPQRDENQIVSFDGEMTRDKFGNSWIHIEERNPPGVFHYSREFLVNISERRTISISSTYEIPDDVKIYLKPTENIQSDDLEIRELSQSITNNSRNDFERISMLAKWVHDNIKYKKSLGNESKDAKWVLENRLGTCDEFSTLFIALSRSIGIPARFVAGYSYGDNGWEEHAFSEAYLGKWIPVDPTNLEIGWLDATHIKFAVSNENLVGSRIKAYGIKDGIEWESKTDISILDYKEGKRLDYELMISSDEFVAGDSAVVILKIKPEEYAFLRLDLQPCVSDFPFIEINDTERDVILEPGREKIVFWRLKVSEDLPENMLYSCPLILNSKFLEPKEVVLNVNTQKSKTKRRDEVELRAELSDPVLGYGRNETIFLHVKRLKGSNPVKIGFVSGDCFKEFYVDSEKHITLSFKPEQLGEHEAIVYSSTGSVLVLNYVVRGVEEIYIDGIEMPSLIKRGKQGKVKLWIRNDRPSLQELKLHTTLDSYEIIRNLFVRNTSLIEIPFMINETGIKRFVFRLTGSGVDTKTIREIRVYDTPEIRVDGLYLPYKKRASVTVDVSKDIARNIEINVGNETKFVPELIGTRTFHFDGIKDLGISITYEDLSGKRYSIKKQLKMKEEDPIETLLRMIDEFIQILIDSFS